MIFFVSFCDTICVTNRDTSSDHFNQARACHLFTHRWPLLRQKHFLFVFILCLTTRTTTAAATEFTQVAAMAAPCKFLIHSKLTSLQASYTLATLCDWCVVSYCCRLLCELRFRCVQPTVLCYGRESSTQQQYTAACRAQQWANTTEEVDGEPTATANTFYRSK